MTSVTLSISKLYNKFGSFTDNRDGETYKTVKIGTQIWMAENLKSTKYNDGTAIPIVINANEWNANEWSGLKTPAYCWYNNDPSNYKATYGALYTWDAVNTGKLCPMGWHVPSDDEWTTLINYLGGTGVAGGKLKETGLTHWIDPNTGATNETGFTALPGGGRGSNFDFNSIGYVGGWWSSTEYQTDQAWGWYLINNDSDVDRGQCAKGNGYSVRCVRDN